MSSELWCLRDTEDIHKASSVSRRHQLWPQERLRIPCDTWLSAKDHFKFLNVMHRLGDFPCGMNVVLSSAVSEDPWCSDKHLTLSCFQ